MTTIKNPFLRQGHSCAERLDRCPNETFIACTDADTDIHITASDPDTTNPFVSGSYQKYDDARSAIDSFRAHGCKSIIVSLSCWGSFDPLSICRDDMKRLVVDENVDAGFASVVGTFGELPRHSEQGFGCCSSRVDVDGSYAISYLFRFAGRDKDKNWKVRQVGVYHQFTQTDQSHLWIFLQSHRREEDAFSIRLSKALATSDGRSLFNQSPFSLHELLIDTYIDQWRWFLNFLGRDYGKQSSLISTASTTSATAFGLTLKSLQDCKKLLENILALPAIFDASLEILSSLANLPAQVQASEVHSKPSIHRPAMMDFRRSSEVLVKQTQGIVDLLGNTLDLKNQEDAGEVNEHLLRLTVRTAKDSETIRVITVVTAFYLPATSLATLFGMNFFNFDDQTRKIVLSEDIWIFALMFVALLALTIFLWWGWVRISVKKPRKGDSPYELQALNS